MTARSIVGFDAFVTLALVALGAPLGLLAQEAGGEGALLPEANQDLRHFIAWSLAGVEDYPR